MDLSSQEQRDKFFADFEKQGESAVRIATLSPAWNNDRFTLGMATEWLRLKDEERALAASKRRDEREEKTLSIARRATINSIIATILSAIAIIVSASDKVILFLQWIGILKP
jgi:hypothetical protein